jgi:sarcosine oxidase subunit beta
MVRKADAVIIGGGIAGVSVAYHLASGGLRDVVLLEKELLLGTGSSSASAGIIYHHLPEKINLQLSQASMRAVLDFEHEFDARIDFRRSGCIQTAATREDLGMLEGIAQELGRMGVRARIVEPQELTDLIPGIVTGDLVGAIYTPDDGHFDPHGMIQGYAARARAMGAKMLMRTVAIGLNMHGNRITGVKTPHGDIDTGIVVNAAGSMAAEVARLAGLQEFPVVPFKRQIFISAPTDIISPDAPFYFDRSPPLYFRPESGGLLISIAEQRECPMRDVGVDWSSVEILAERATRRVPRLQSIRIVRGWAGLRNMTPDHTAILGPVPEPSGFYCAVGFSGHGVMHAPVTGRILASMIIDRNLDRYEHIDLAPLRFERFLVKKPSFS